MKKLLLFGAFVLSINAFGQVPNYVPTNGLVGWWPFNGNANDESGNGNNGTVNGATLTTDRFGSADAAYTFDGSNYIIVQDALALNPDYTSVSIWFQTISTSSGSLIYKTEASAINEQYGCVLNYPSINNTVWSVKNGNNCTSPGIGWQTTNMNNNISDGNWHHIVCTYNGSLLEIYLDNSLITSGSFSASVIDPCGGEINIGKGYNSLYMFIGEIDDIGIWNRALTQCEIQDLYNAQLNSASTATDIQSACDSYTWVDGNTYTTSNNSATYTTSTAAGCDSTVTLDLTINPTPDNSITQNGGSLTATQTGATYQWIDCDNFFVPVIGEVNQTFFPSLSGYYAVEVTIGDCSSTSECRLVDFTGIDEIESIISVHPNPTKDEVTLSIGTALLETEFVVTDNAGRIILTDTFKSTKQKVNLSGFDNGVYFIRTDKESPVKIIKQ